MKDYRGRQLARLGAVIFILFLIAGLINACAIFYGSMHRYKVRQKVAVEHSLNDLNMGIDLFNQNYFWFLNFYQEHYAEMHINDKPLQDIIDDGLSLAEKYGYQLPTQLTVEEMESLSDEEKLIIADLAYTSGSNVYNLDLSNYGMEVDAIIRLLIPRENGKAFVVYETDPDFLSNPDRNVWAEKPKYPLGKIVDFNLDDYPNAKIAYTTGFKQLDPEEIYSLLDRKMVSNYYVPLKEEGVVLGLVQLSVDWSENIRVTWQNAWQVELINLIVLAAAGAIILYLVKMLTDRVTALSGEQEKKNTELSIAQNIQLQNLPNVFPAFPERKDFDIYASMDTFHEVGGDFYDYFFIDDDHLALVIADVSDKGVPAALFMMMAKTRINAIALSEKDYSPSKILEKANNSLCENNDSVMFVTVWLGILTLSTGELLTANGGHLDPMICAGGKFSVCQENHGLMLGAMKDQKYDANRWKLDKGDIIFVCTDGAIEAMDENDQEFGCERLLDVLNRNQGKELSDMFEAVRTAVDDYSGKAGRFDDITMLAVRLN